MWLVLVEGKFPDLSFTNAAEYYGSASGFTTRSDIGPARKVLLPKLYYYYYILIIFLAKLKKGGEEVTVDPEQFQDPDNEYGLFAGTTYEQDDEEADKIYDSVDEAMDNG